MRKFRPVARAAQPTPGGCDRGRSPRLRRAVRAGAGRAPLWRAGFGPRPGEARSLSARKLDGAVRRLLRPGLGRLHGPPPHVEKGKPLRPLTEFGHDHLWWLDRMVRSDRPLQERTTYLWHDWFPSSNDDVRSQRLMLKQNALFRRHGLGSFWGLFTRVTIDPAMLVYLSGIMNDRAAPNENDGREMMELFSLGADNYTEDDVRENARALTGWTADYKSDYGYFDFRFEQGRHDPFYKTIFGKSGKFDWRDSVRLCVAHPIHPSYFCRRFWSYFVPVDPDDATQTGLEQLYVESGYRIAPVVAAILKHPLLYEGPRMVLSPVVHMVGMLRRLGRGIDTEDWVSIHALAGQQLFYPPNVGGWDESRWLDTSTFHARWIAAQRVLERFALDPDRRKAAVPADPDALVAQAVAFWHEVELSDPTRAALRTFAARAVRAAWNDADKQGSYSVMTLNALRHLIAAAPEVQTA